MLRDLLMRFLPTRKISIISLLFIGILLLINHSEMMTSTPNIIKSQSTTSDSLSINSKSLKIDIAKSSVFPLERKIQNNAFHVGERLTFSVRYGIIRAGEASMAVQDSLTIGDRTALQIISTANSAKTFDLFFKVRDHVETWLDKEGIFSWKFQKILREGAYKFDLLVDYDQRSGKADVQTIRYHNDEPLKVKKHELFELKTPAYILDILAAFYYVRTQDLQIGMPIYMTNHDNKKIYDLKVIIQKKEEKKVKAGKFHCIKLQPRLRGDAIFKQKGELWVWVSDDRYKIPVLMKSAVFVGNITTELTKIEGITLPLPSQIN
jgi:hypothetical protein